MNDFKIILISIIFALCGFVIGWLCREEKAVSQLYELRKFYNWLKGTP